MLSFVTMIDLANKIFLCGLVSIDLQAGSQRLLFFISNIIFYSQKFTMFPF